MYKQIKREYYGRICTTHPLMYIILYSSPVLAEKKKSHVRQDAETTVKYSAVSHPISQ